MSMKGGARGYDYLASPGDKKAPTAAQPSGAAGAGADKLSQPAGAQAPARDVLVVDAALPQIEPRLLAELGETFRDWLAQLARELHQLVDTLGAPQVNALSAQAERLRHLASQVQHSGALLAGLEHAKPMLVDLRIYADKALKKVSAEAARRGRGISLRGLAGEAWIAPGPLDLLLTLGTEWALDMGRLVQLSSSFSGSHAGVQLNWTVAASAPVAAVAASASGGRSALDMTHFDDLRWRLFAVVANGLALQPYRMLSEGSIAFGLHLPPPPVTQEREGLSIRETTSSAGSIARSVPAAGSHVLIVDPNEISRYLARDLIHQSGLMVRAARSIAEAVEMSADYVVDLLITGIDPASEPLRMLRAELERANPQLRVLELTEGDSDFEIAPPEPGGVSRLGRGALERLLIPAVSFELSV